MSASRSAILVALLTLAFVTVPVPGRSSKGPNLQTWNLELSGPAPATDPFISELQERTFRFFWDTANPDNGLIPDRYPTPSYSSIAAVGFGLTTYPIGVERGYITREQARERVLATLRFFYTAPQSSELRGATGFRGFFYHYLDMRTGERFGDSELSTVDTAILVAGMLFCQS